MRIQALTRYLSQCESLSVEEMEREGLLYCFRNYGVCTATAKEYIATAIERLHILKENRQTKLL